MNKLCFVFSRTLSGKNQFVEFVNENIIDFVNKLKLAVGKNIWIVVGGEILHDFIEYQLVDEWIINIAPTIIEDGIPLFTELHYETIK